MEFKEKAYVVFGGTGSIGGAIAKQLESLGARVSKGSRVNDVVKESYVRAFLGDKRFDGAVYAVGRCPPKGFDDAIQNPLSALPIELFARELEMHMKGLFVVFQELLPRLNLCAPFLVVSSAITRLTDETCPPWLYSGHYASAKAGQDELVRWMRRDSIVRNKKILIHRLAFGAVATAFYEECIRRPPAMLPLEEAVREAIEALKSSVVVDNVVVASPPRN